MRFSLVHNGIGYTEFTATELATRGVPQAVIDQAIAAIRRDAIKAECSRRIFAVASAPTQQNMAAAASVIAGKTVAARSDAEKAVLAGMETALGWVQAMRGAIAPLSADATADYQSDAVWPACPAAVIALAAQF